MITLILVILAAVFNALMDISSENKFKRSWWNKEESWRNKYKDGDPLKGPAFPLSTTVLVFLTDGWHLAQFLFHTSWQLALAFQTESWLLSFVVIKVIFSACFQVLYSKLK